MVRDSPINFVITPHDFGCRRAYRHTAQCKFCVRFAAYERVKTAREYSVVRDAGLRRSANCAIDIPINVRRWRCRQPARRALVQPLHEMTRTGFRYPFISAPSSTYSPMIRISATDQ
jgi:hypothetical protein